MRLRKSRLYEVRKEEQIDRMDNAMDNAHGIFNR